MLADSRLFLLLQSLAVKLTFANVAKDELRHFRQADFHFDLVQQSYLFVREDSVCVTYVLKHLV